MTNRYRVAELERARSELATARELVTSDRLKPSDLSRAGELVEFWGNKVAFLEVVPVDDDPAAEMED